MSARVIDENAPHQLGRDAEKLCPVSPARAVLAHELQVGLIYQGSRLERVFTAFPSKVGPSQAMQFVVDERH